MEELLWEGRKIRLQSKCVHRWHSGEYEARTCEHPHSSQNQAWMGHPPYSL